MSVESAHKLTFLLWNQPK